MKSCGKYLQFRVDLQYGRFSLHEAVFNGNAATVESVIVAAGPGLIDIADLVK